MTRSFRIFLGAWLALETAHWLGMGAVTYLVLQRSGLTWVSAVQGLPLLATVALTPLLGAFIDRRSAKRVVRVALVFAAVRACGHLWFQTHWYVALMVLDMLAMTVFGLVYVRMLPVLVPGDFLDRATGWSSVGTNLARTIGLAAGPFIGYHIGVAVFALVALGYIISAILFAWIAEDVGADGHAAARHKASLWRDLRQGAVLLISQPDGLRLAMLFALAFVCWGIGEVLALAIAQDRLRIPEQWTGLYAASATVAEIGGAWAIARGFSSSQHRVTRVVGTCVLILAASYIGLAFTRSPVLGFGLKMIEGAVSVLIGILCQNALVLRSPAHMRAKLSALLSTMGSATLFASKLATGQASLLVSAVTIHAAGGLLVLCATLVILAWQRAASAPTRATRSYDV